MTTIFIAIFLTLYIVDILIDLWLTYLNVNHLTKYKDFPPSLFADHIEPERYQKSIAYTKVRQKFSVVCSLFSSIVFLLFIYTGAMNWVNLQLTELIPTEIHRGVCFFVILSFASYLIGIPFSLYSSFVIEEKFGFNRQTIGIWLKDQLKQNTISNILLVVLSYTILYFMSYAGDLWWFYVWAVVFLFGFTLSKLYPILIAPLFNKFTPIPDGELRDTLEKLSQEANFPLENIYEMDASLRTSHPNAYFSGFGKTKRLVLFDSLIKEFSKEEIASVVAHEIGHDRKKHIWKSLFLSQSISLLFFYCLYLVLQNPYLYKIFLISQPSTYMGLVLLGMLTSLLTSYFSPVFNLLSWKFEKEADLYSYNIIEKKEAIKTMLIKLTVKNLSNLSPHPAYARFNYSHPPVMERLKALGLSEPA